MANWQTKLDLTAIWPKDEDEIPDIKAISAEISRQLRTLDLSFLKEDDPYRQMAIEHADEFKELAEQEEPDVEDFDDLMQGLYNWADTQVSPVGSRSRKKMCWVATHF